jgi:hypothetical protein
MKTKLTIFLTFIVSLLLIAQEDYITWDRMYGDDCDDYAVCVTELSDGNYLVGGKLGYEWADGRFSSLSYLLKIDPYGNIIWDLPYIVVKNSPTTFYDALETRDGNIIALTYQEISGLDGSKYAPEILKIDMDGKILWTKCYPHGMTSIAYSIVETADSNLVFCGNSRLNDSLRVGLMMMVDQQGDSLWTAELTIDSINVSYSTLSSIKYDENSSKFYAAGNSGSYYRDSWIVVLDTEGNIIRNETYEVTGVSNSFRSLDLSNGYIYAAGEKSVISKSHSDIRVVKTDTKGNIIWDRSWGLHSEESDGANSVAATDDGGCIITGYTHSDTFTIHNFAMRISSDGDSLWTKIFKSVESQGNYFDSEGKDIIQTTDGGFLLGGWGAKDLEYYFNYDMWVFKLDPEGNYVGIENNVNTVRSFELFQNYPNPFNNQTQILYSLKQAATVELNVYNVKGEIIRKLVSKNHDSGSYSVSFNADDLNSGIYYYQLKINGIVKDTKRMVYLK